MEPPFSDFVQKRGETTNDMFYLNHSEKRLRKAHFRIKGSSAKWKRFSLKKLTTFSLVFHFTVNT